MTRTLMCGSIAAFLVTLIVGPVAAAENRQSPLAPVDDKAIAERVKSLAKETPEGAKLVAFLDCGVQVETAKNSTVAIKKLKGDAYKFQADEAKVPATQPTVFFDNERVVFELSGIDRTGHYLVGLTWWDFDAGGRVQTVMVASPGNRNVRIAVPTIGLPDFTKSKKLPAQKQFTLPATFAKDGKVQIAVIQAAGANAVISELWVWQLP
jgi:hypothetical protein